MRDLLETRNSRLWLLARVIQRALESDFIVWLESKRAFAITARGLAALAAPKITQAELRLLQFIERYAVIPHYAKSRMIKRFEWELGRIEYRNGVYRITDPAGRDLFRIVRTAVSW